jgi:predicted ATPase
MIKKVVLTGGPCCGKSTLISELKKRGYNTIPEVARRVLEEREDYEPNKEELTTRQLMIYKKQIEIESQLNQGLHFLDRGIYDAVCYSNFLIGEVPFNIDYKKRYTQVFILDRLKFEDDGIRIEDEQSAKEIHKSLEKEYILRGYQPIKVPVFGERLENGLKERINFILTNLGELKR